MIWRPRVRYSVKALLLLTTLIGLWLGAQSLRVQRQNEAVAWVRAHGGSVTFEWSGPLWLRFLVPEDYMQKVTTVVLHRGNVRDVTPLADLRALTFLSLAVNSIDDISPLSNLKHLEELDLTSNQISDVEPLRSLRSLKRLRLADNRIQEVSALAELDQLSYLNLTGNQLSDAAPLSTLTKTTIYASRQRPPEP